MITCRLQGGLGNMLFQIAATYALAIEHNDTPIINLDQGHSFPHKRPEEYKYNIFKKLNLGNNIDNWHNYAEHVQYCDWALQVMSVM